MYSMEQKNLSGQIIKNVLPPSGKKRKRAISTSWGNLWKGFDVC